MIAYDKWCLYIDAEQNKYNLTTILVHGVLSVAKSNGNGSPYFYHVNLSVFVGIYSLLLKWNKSQDLLIGLSSKALSFFSLILVRTDFFLKKYQVSSRSIIIQSSFDS